MATATAGCAVTTSFSPYSSVQEAYPQVTDLAVRLRPGDKVHIGKANADVLGWVNASSDSTDDDVMEEVQREAARQGGTHILASGSRSEIVAAWGYGNVAYPVRKGRAWYLVLRVPPDRWEGLPGPLRPQRRSTEK